MRIVCVYLAPFQIFFFVICVSVLVAYVHLFYRWWSRLLVYLAYRDPFFGFLIHSYGYSIVRLSGLTDCGFLAVEGPAVSLMF